MLQTKFQSTEQKLRAKITDHHMIRELGIFKSICIITPCDNWLSFAIAKSSSSGIFFAGDEDSRFAIGSSTNQAKTNDVYLGEVTFKSRNQHQFIML